MNKTGNGRAGPLLYQWGYRQATLSRPQGQQRREICLQKWHVSASVSTLHQSKNNLVFVRPQSASSSHNPVLRNGQDLIPYLSSSLKLEIIEGELRITYVIGDDK
jgi:hypothetical protein